MRRVLAVVVTLACVGVVPASAQTYQQMTSARRATGEASLAVHVEFAVGHFGLQAAPAGQLYRADLLYDADKFTPTVTYDPTTHALEASIDGSDNHGDVHYRNGSRQHLYLELDPDVPLALDLKFGAAVAAMDLGGLTLSRAEIQTGASADTLRVSSPTKGTCSSFSIKVGAAEFIGDQLGNLQCADFSVETGIGSVDLDLSGSWPKGTSRNVRIKAGLAKVRITLPRGLGVRLHEERFLSSTDRPGFTKRGSDYYSTGYDSAAAHLELNVSTTMGVMEIRWVGATP
ncbi:MAG TPA: LiaF domain-containing protein [Gemmatimonadales bacterium]|nr:LiaF domain-containing protein [Gemmatimonadales bacterium]